MSKIRSGIIARYDGKNMNNQNSGGNWLSYFHDNSLVSGSWIKSIDVNLRREFNGSVVFYNYLQSLR